MESSFHIFMYPLYKPSQLSSTISITDTEKQIFSIITSILSKHNKHTTICRVAGGWVRDKLLNKESLDIDIAINNLKGSDLAKMINDELYPNKDKYGIIQQNVEKGKHLETATIKICNIWIDFVNLRSATDNIIGTPKEDAEHRDITFNSLFYNIHTSQVEDFTNKGIHDLQEGIVRTPIEPILTFRDDPLRILRIIRFAVKYQFAIADEVSSCIINNINEFRNKYYNNIANERITKELGLIFESEYAQSGIFLLYHYGLLESIIKVQLYNNSELKVNKHHLITNEDIISNVNEFLICDIIFKKHMKSNIIHHLYCDLMENINKRKSFYFFILIMHYRSFILKDKKENCSFIKVIANDILKLNNEDKRDIITLSLIIEELILIVNDKKGFQRLTTGKMIRNIKYEHLFKMIVASIAVEYCEQEPKGELIVSIKDNKLEGIINKYNSFLDFVYNEGLLHVDEMQPLLDGMQMIKELNMKPGKEIGILIESLVEEQICNPGMNREVAVEFLQKKREEIKNNKNAFGLNDNVGNNINGKKKNKNKK